MVVCIMGVDPFLVDVGGQTAGMLGFGWMGSAY